MIQLWPYFHQSYTNPLWFMLWRLSSSAGGQCLTKRFILRICRRKAREKWRAIYPWSFRPSSYTNQLWLDSLATAALAPKVTMRITLNTPFLLKLTTTNPQEWFNFSWNLELPLNNLKHGDCLEFFFFLEGIKWATWVFSHLFIDS